MATSQSVSLFHGSQRRVREVLPGRHQSVVGWAGRCCFLEAEVVWALEQAKLTGAGDGLGAAFDLELVEDHAVVALDSIEGEKESLADLAV